MAVLVLRSAGAPLTNSQIDANFTNLNNDIQTRAPKDSPAFTGTPTGITKSHVGLGNVDNTSDASKPISTATQNALNAKQDALVSGTNLKTLSGQSLLGSGDIAVTGTGGTTGSITYVDVTANRAYDPVGDKGKVLRCSPAGTNRTITVNTGAQAAGDVFATAREGAGTLTVVAGSGITLVDVGGKVAAQQTDGTPVLWRFQSATKVVSS